MQSFFLLAIDTNNNNNDFAKKSFQKIQSKSSTKMIKIPKY